MTIREAIDGWPSIGWGGPYDGTDNLQLNPATTIIERVWLDDGRIWIEAKANTRRVRGSILPKEELFQTVHARLESAIGETLDNAGGIVV